MNRLEDELRNSLRRKEPSPEFMECLLNRIPTRSSRRMGRWQRVVYLFQPRGMRWALSGAIACLLVAGGIVQYRSYQKTRAEGELAKTQLMLALKITSQKLSFAQRKVIEMSNRGTERRGE
jgi:hypothetical protein